MTGMIFEGFSIFLLVILELGFYFCVARIILSRRKKELKNN